MNKTPPENHHAFIIAFGEKFPNRFGRKRRFIPEIPQSPEIIEHLHKNGFKKSDNYGYETAILDLTKTEDELRQGLKKNWRGALKKAEKEGITIDWHTDMDTYLWLRSVYETDKKTKGYDGPSVKLVDHIANMFVPAQSIVIGVAKSNNKKIGAVMFLCHGQTTTYQIGWSNAAGRTQNAHNLLLWKGILHLKQRGIKTLDLGGFNDHTAKGIKKFKTGMGGSPLTLAGLYT